MPANNPPPRTPTMARAAMQSVAARRDAAIRQIRSLRASARMARRLFCDGGQELSRDGAEFFRWLHTQSGMGKMSQAASDREETWNAAQRALALKIMALIDIDEQRLSRLNRIATGVDDNE